MDEPQQKVSVAHAELEMPLSSKKPIHTIILDSTPLLLNTPSLSTLLANSEALVTTHSVISEIRDRNARERIETLYLPFVTLRQPEPESVNIIKRFAQKTGDAAVLSKTDFEVLALAYDLECERNQGDWRLRRVPGQKRLNGNPPKKVDFINLDEVTEGEEKQPDENETSSLQEIDTMTYQFQNTNILDSKTESDVALEPEDAKEIGSNSGLQDSALRHTSQQPQRFLDETAPSETELTPLSEDLSSDSDSAEWITPSNIKKYQANDGAASNSTKSDVKTLQVATITGDFAMQNVLLQMNLNLLSPATCKRIEHIKQTILRCHGCFATTKDMTKQFCPRCGNPTLTRVTCTTNDRGEVRLHLKANMQWNNRGNVFSIPKPVAGSANQKWKGPKQGGGQSGWGNELILAEDQKEYIRAMSDNRRSVKKDLMDEDYLPSILTGDRTRAGGRVRVGAGRNVNSRKK